MPRVVPPKPSGARVVRTAQKPPELPDDPLADLDAPKVRSIYSRAAGLVKGAWRATNHVGVLAVALAGMGGAAWHFWPEPPPPPAPEKEIVEVAGQGLRVYPLLPAIAGDTQMSDVYAATSCFGPRRLRGKDVFHWGIDLRAGEGTVVVAAAAGQVTDVETVEIPGVRGLSVDIVHAGGFATTYRHLSRIDVRVDQQVKAGEAIALSGATGDVTGPHLHFDVWTRGKRIDPLSWFEGQDPLPGEVRALLNARGSAACQTHDAGDADEEAVPTP